MNTIETEILENQLKYILWNTSYKELKYLDFIHYDILLRNIKGHKFDTEEEYLTYKRNMFRGISQGNYNKPELQLDDNGILWCLDGEVRLLTCKVLGIDPVVILKYPEKQKIEIKDHRLMISSSIFSSPQII